MEICCGNATVNSLLTSGAENQRGAGASGGEYAMSTESLICPELNQGLTPLATHRKAHALRYDDLSRVLVDFGQYAPTSKKPTRGRKSGIEQDDLWIHLAVLRAENDRLRDLVSDQLHHFARRVAELERQIRRPWWRRMFGSAEPIEPPRNRASEQLRVLYCGSAGVQQRPT
jgi:hypothetical protein